ncbi:hypothetical protein [Catenulispora pinisilvae]|uniref:hypothetical protein n=1 Tax=Catenulispora pinisilvae TaxID=2705253 RepID=UPI0018921CA7|nr:hypothetical protein [Catenulispora pinisilvae]
MSLIPAHSHVPKHADRRVRTQTGAGADYVGVRRKPEPDWFLAFLDGVMQANRFRVASGYLTDLERR